MALGAQSGHGHVAADAVVWLLIISNPAEVEHVWWWCLPVAVVTCHRCLCPPDGFPVAFRSLLLYPSMLKKLREAVSRGAPCNVTTIDDAKPSRATSRGLGSQCTLVQ
jgi:hypothetical protein